MSLAYDELPNIGDEWHPVFLTGAIGIDSYGAEVVLVTDENYATEFLVLCFRSGNSDNAPWKVVAVIDESTMRHIARYLISEIL